MSFLTFVFYYFICTIIFVILGVLIYKFYLKKKFKSLSDITANEIDKYFNSYDDNTEVKNFINELYNNDKNDDFLKEVGK